MKRAASILSIAVVLVAVTISVQAEKHAITFDDLIALGRIGSFEVSPDGRNIAFTVTWFDKEANSSNTDIYLVPVKGGDPYRFVRSDGADYDNALEAYGSAEFLSEQELAGVFCTNAARFLRKKHLCDN